MSETSPRFDAVFHQQFQELLAWRRDVRRFKRTPLPDGLLDELIDEACLSPSVGNCQPWRFVVVEHEGRRAAVCDSFERCNEEALSSFKGEKAEHYARLKLSGLEDAPIHLAVFAEPNPTEGGGLGRLTMPETVAYSVVGAIQTLWLSARLRGIGVGWVSILEPEHLNGMLGVPSHWQLIAYLCIGYPQRETRIPELVSSGWQDRLNPRDLVFRR